MLVITYTFIQGVLTMDIKQIGTYLKEKRISKGYTQKELSEILNVSPQAVSRWENGDNLPDVMKLNELSKLYNVSIEELLQEEKHSEVGQKTRVLSTLTVLSIVISCLTVVLYYSMIGSGIQIWLNVLILYLLIMLNSLLYALPFSLKKESINLTDLNYLMLGLSSTLFAVGMTLIPVVEKTYMFYPEYLMNGPVISVILIGLNISIFSIIKNKLFGSRMNYITERLSSVSKQVWRKLIIILSISTIILVPPILYGGDVAFLTVLVGGFTTIALITMLVLNFNVVALLISIGYMYTYGFLCFYVFSLGEMTEEAWEIKANASSYFEDAVGILIIVLLIGLVVLHWLYKTYLSKNRKSIYLGASLFFLQTFSVLWAAPTFTHERQTENGSVVFNRYRLTYSIENTIVFQIVILTISIFLFLEFYKRIRSWSLNKAK